MSAVVTTAYWRAAGMSYVKYANLCAEMVRVSLKEPFLTKAKPRETVYFKSTLFEAGKPQKSVITEVTSASK